MHEKAGFQGNGVEPVTFVDLVGGVAPVPQVRTNAKRRDDVLHLVLQGRHAGPIQMVPMVVSDEQVVDGRHVLRGIDASAWKRSIGDGHWSRIAAENRIDQQSPATQLDEVGRVT
ncbi:hypothetical protein G6F22_021540 [Rhizopus arrhizus]|nr:hypothetical protein G6F22_021540 [Rhizopus arrhizus]